MSLILVAHGTRSAAGIAIVDDLAEQASAVVGETVQVAFVDVLGPAPSELLSDPEPAIVLPAFLSRGYHVRTDLPAQVAASGHPDVTVTPALGPSPEVARIVTHQLIRTGWRPGDSVILAAAGTSDRMAHSDLRTTAAMVSSLIGSPVQPESVVTEHGIADAVAKARARSSRRVVVASYLLADGLFQGRLRRSGADLVTEPLGRNPALVRLIAGRFQAAAMCLAA
ncbi:cobalamin biosynthesis protein CbiX [Mycobacterium kyorinense]|uniref:Cobalamin biosynthesis protein CbiX n=1 Tax=Mycobacterium kyorinense TaxID=487514 RepID=A0A1A2ZGW3_9MYCO|nr:sirohydrochlorin chelatase [Mycobacterium kyorinense]OBI49495.1 cobalamin biosynthesis protein CbiX [Mycobacterium kyorinense]